MAIHPKKAAGTAPASHANNPERGTAPASLNVPEPERSVSVLAVSHFEQDHVSLEHIFSRSKWQIRNVRTWTDGLECLSRQTVAVIICESDLPDGTWKDVLEDLTRLPDAPALIVTSRIADDLLWAEVLNYGGYDMLAKPFDATEVFRVVSLAWLNWKHKRDHRRSAAAQSGGAAAAAV